MGVLLRDEAAARSVPPYYSVDYSGSHACQEDRHMDGHTVEGINFCWAFATLNTQCFSIFFSLRS
jgi:hypothetical protein